MILTFRKVTALPSTLAPNAVYMVAPDGAPADYLEIYVTNATGTAARHVPTRGEIQTMITNAVAGLGTGDDSDTAIVANIAERNALAPDTIMFALVLDATGDASVKAGAATYVFNTGTSAWVKVSEAESMDFVLQWANIQGRPDRTAAQIEAAVDQRHTHTNMTQLNLIGQDTDGNLTYNGQNPAAGLQTADW